MFASFLPFILLLFRQQLLFALSKVVFGSVVILPNFGLILKPYFALILVRWPTFWAAAEIFRKMLSHSRWFWICSMSQQRCCTRRDGVTTRRLCWRKWRTDTWKVVSCVFCFLVLPARKMFAWFLQTAWWSSWKIESSFFNFVWCLCGRENIS